MRRGVGQLATLGCLFIVFCQPAWAGTTPYGVVDRANGYTAEMAMTTGPATIHIARADLAAIHRVVVSVKDRAKPGWFVIYDGPPAETLAVRYQGPEPVTPPLLLELLWRGTLPDGHGTISWADGSAGGGGAGPPAAGTGDLRLHFDFSRPPSATSVDDLSGNGNHGLFRGAVRWLDGRGLFLGRDAGYVEVPDAPSLHSPRGVTVIAHFIPLSMGPKPWQAIVWKGNLPDQLLQREYSLWVHSSGALHAAATPASGSLQTIQSSPRVVTTEAVVAAVFDPSSGMMRLYLNGSEAARGPLAGGLMPTQGPLLLGGVPGVEGNPLFNGYLRSLRVVGRALTEAEVRSLAGPPAPSPGGALRSGDLCHPDGAVLGGIWAAAVPIKDDQYFARLDLARVERSVAVEDGVCVCPGNDGPTEMVYRHDGSSRTLTGFVAVLDDLGQGQGASGSVDFVVTGDGRALWQSGRIVHASPATPFQVSLAGVRELRLAVTDGGNGTAQDWGAYLNLRLSP